MDSKKMAKMDLRNERPEVTRERRDFHMIKADKSAVSNLPTQTVYGQFMTENDVPNIEMVV